MNISWSNYDFYECNVVRIFWNTLTRRNLPPSKHLFLKRREETDRPKNTRIINNPKTVKHHLGQKELRLNCITTSSS